jgi:nitrogen fixation protein FixH
MTAATKWLLAIVGLLLANLIAMVVLIAASSSGSSRVLPHYYDRAVHYDDAIEQAANNRALGWQVSARFVNRVLVVELRDRDGAPIDGATIEVDGAARARARAFLYRSPVAPGIYDLTITAEKGGARFVERVVAEAR